MKIKITHRILSFVLIIILDFYLNPYSISSQIKPLQGFVISDETKRPLVGVQVTISNNEFTKEKSTDFSGHFEFACDSNFGDPKNLLCEKEGYFARIFSLEDQNSNDLAIVLERASFLTVNTLNFFGEIRDKNTNQPIPDISVYADYGEIPTISDQNGAFNIFIHHPNMEEDILIWLGHEEYKSIVFRVSDPKGYSNVTNMWQAKIERIPPLYYFNFSVGRSDKDQPIKNVRVEIINEYAGQTDDYGKVERQKLFDDNTKFVKVKFSHSSFIDTVITIALSNLSSIKISREVKLNPLSFLLNSIVYYESSDNTLKGVPNAKFEFYSKKLGSTNSSGESLLHFRAIPGDTISIKLPSTAYSPLDTIVVLTKDQRDLKIKVRKYSITITINPIDEKNGKSVAEVDSLILICNNYVVRTQKIGTSFIAITNIFSDGDKITPFVFSKAYGNKNSFLELTKDSIREYSSNLYLKKNQD